VVDLDHGSEIDLVTQGTTSYASHLALDGKGDAPLILHNVFDLLTSDGVEHSREALLPNLNTTDSAAVQLTTTQSEDLAIPIETVCSFPGIRSEAPLPKGTRPSSSIIPSDDRHGMVKVGRKLFPNPLSHSIEKDNDVGRLSFPGVVSVSDNRALDPSDIAKWAATPMLSPVIPSPITTYVDFLGPDKRSFMVPQGPSIPNEANSKSVMILKKFWGDEENDDCDSGAQTDNTSRSIKYLQDNMLEAPSSKVGRPKKKTRMSTINWIRVLKA